MATMYKGIDYLEAYLGDEKENMPGVLEPAQFFDLWNSLNIMNDLLRRVGNRYVAILRK